MYVELKPFPLVTPKGPGMCIAVMDGGIQHHLTWVVIDDATGQIWSWENPQVRGDKNLTWGRSSPEVPDAQSQDKHSPAR